jgi:hypothetical protein
VPGFERAQLYSLLKNSGSCSVLKGLGFSRAVTSLFSVAALAAEVHRWARQDFFRNLMKSRSDARD